MNNYKITQRNVITLPPSPMFTNFAENSASACCTVVEVINLLYDTIGYEMLF